MKTQEAKEKLLALKAALEKIEARKSKGINVFEAAGLVTQEVKHSAFLAWLLNPKMPHGLGSLFLRKFCERLVAYRTDGNEAKQNFEIIGHALDRQKEMLCDGKTEVLTEKVVVNSESRIDVFIASAAAKTVMVIENKVFTSMHDDQLNRYENELAAHPEYTNYNKVFVYLTPNGDLPNDEDWCTFDYGEVLDIVREIYKELPRTKSSDRLRILLEDYIETVDTNILKGNRELRSLCKQILREHGEAIRILNEYTDNVEEAIEYCKNYLKQNYNSIVIYKDSKLSLFFYTKSIKDYFDKHGECLLKKGLPIMCGGSLGQWNGPIESDYSLNKSVEDEWSVAQKKIMEAVAPKKKRGTKYFRFGNIKLLSEEVREQPFEEIKEKLNIKLNELIADLKKFDELLETL